MEDLQGGEGAVADEFIAFLDVGHGDCCVLVSPATKQAAVVDCPDASIAIDFLQRHQVTTLRYVLVTHLDSDHSHGVVSLIRTFHGLAGTTYALYYNLDQLTGAGPGYKPLVQELAKLRDLGCCNRHATLEGQPLELPLLGEARTRLLYPEKPDVELMLDQQNDASAVTLIECRGNRVLLTGDVEREGCNRLIDRYPNSLSADILKIPHHGGWHGSLVSLLTAVAPCFAVISCGTTGKGDVPRVEGLRQLGEVFKQVPCVLCTQLTTHCHPDPEAIAAKLIDSLPEESKLGRSSRGQGGVPCGGTIYFHLSANGITVTPQPAVRAGAVNEAGGTPCCCELNSD